MKPNGLTLVLALVGACAPVPPQRATTPRALAPSAQSSTLPVVEPWALRALPLAAAPAWVHSRQGDALFVTRGALRAELRAGRAILAADPMPAPIVGAAPIQDAWLFALEDGTLVRAATFLAPPARAGDAGVTLSEALPTGVGLILRSARRSVFVVDARGEVHASDLPPGQPILAALMRGDGFGLALVTPGEVYRTLDGGAHFERVPAGSEAALSLRSEGERFILDTTRGRLRVGREGPAEPDASAHAATLETSSRLPPESESELTAAIAASHPFALAIAPPSPAGRLLLDLGNSLALREPDGALQRLVAPPPGCAARMLTERPVASCTEGAHLLAYEGGQWSPWPRTGARVLLFGSDGASLLLQGACTGNGTSHTAACWYDGNTWLDVALPPGARTLALSRRALIYQFQSEEVGRNDFFRLWRGAQTPETLHAENGRLVWASLAADGTTHGIVDLQGRRALAFGSEPGTLAVSALPAGVSALVFADRTHGAAVDEASGRVWLTENAGQHWSEIDARFPREAVDPALGRLQIQCGTTLCLLEHRAIWIAPGALRAMRLSLHALQAPARTTTNNALPSSLPTPRSAGRWRCTALSPTPTPPDASRWLLGGGGFAEIVGASHQSWTSGPIQVRWGGSDSEGRYVRSSSTGSLRRYAGRSEPGASGSPTFALRSVTRRLALLTRCAASMRAPGTLADCEIIAAPLQGPPHSLGTFSQLFETRGSTYAWGGALALPDGTTLVRITADPPPDRRGPALDLVLRVGPRGQLLARRAFAWADAREARMLAYGARGPGLVSAPLDAPRLLTFYPLDASAEPAPARELPAGEWNLCSDEEPTNAMHVLVRAPGYEPELTATALDAEDLRVGSAAPLLEIPREGEACLRGFVSAYSGEVSSEVLTRLGGLPRVHAHRGALAGVAIHPLRGVPLRCTR